MTSFTGMRLTRPGCPAWNGPTTFSPTSIIDIGTDGPFDCRNPNKWGSAAAEGRV